MNCGYSPDGDRCNLPIQFDIQSASGYSHEVKADFQHWASPEVYGMGQAETQRIFKPCVICDKKEPDNEEHVRYNKDGGHTFIAKMEN